MSLQSTLLLSAALCLILSSCGEIGASLKAERSVDLVSGLHRTNVTVSGSAATAHFPRLESIKASHEHVFGFTIEGKPVAYSVSKSNLEALRIPHSLIPSGVSRPHHAKELSFAIDHAVALKGDGTVVTWGKPSFPGLRLTEVPAGLDNVKAIAAGPRFSLALKEDNTVVSWGNSYISPSKFIAELRGVKAIEVGILHGLALKNDGTVVAWGENGYGQTNVPLRLENIKAISTQWTHNLALKSDGTVVAWGENSWGQTNVPAGLKNVKAIAAGGTHSLALVQNGSVVAWGKNSGGQADVPAGLKNVKAIAAGYDFSLALLENGRVVVWPDKLKEYGKEVKLRFQNLY